MYLDIMYWCMRVRMNEFMYVCMYVCVCVHACMKVCVCKYIHMHSRT